MYTPLISLLVLLFGLLSLVNCGNSPSCVPPEPRQAPALASLASGLYWSSVRDFPSKLIPVCFEQENYPSESDRWLVRDQIKTTFEPSTGLHFVGWEQCSAGDPYSSGIHIVNRDAWPYVHQSMVEAPPKGEKDKMVLNFIFLESFDDCASPSSYRAHCIKSIAAHEFGHALGAWHEQTRPDRPSACSEWLVATNQASEARIETQRRIIASANPGWDWQSIMNYCNNEHMQWNGINYAAQFNLRWNNAGVLSPNDLVNVQQKYGVHKMMFEAATPSGPLPAGFTQGFSSKRGTKDMPDIYTLYFGPGTTGSGKMELHALSAKQNYQSWMTHISLPLDLYPVNDAEDQFFFADMDNDGRPELFYTVHNPSTKRLELHGLSSSTNWQNYYLHVATPVGFNDIQKYAVADYDGDGVPDLFVARSTTASSSYLEILSGSTNFSRVVYSGLLPFTIPQLRSCRFVAGNFYNHSAGNKSADLVCMMMDKTSSNTPISIFALNASQNFTVLQDLGNTQLLGENGKFAGFGAWDYGVHVGKTRGAGMAIGFLKRQNSPSTEIHWMQADLLF